VSRPDADPAAFRRLLSRFASGVTVLTTRGPAGQPVGMTASSLASVSLVPPLVSVCVDVSADMHRALSVSGEFVVNILRADQEHLSRRFSITPADERFQGVGWRETSAGLIVLEDTIGHIECERYTDLALGDHTLFVGRVTGGETAEGVPLLYFRGGYGTLARE